jgi:hypothetical protein
MNTRRGHRLPADARTRGVLRTPAILAATIALAIAAGGGIAYAYWSATGSGNASAANGTMQPVTVTAFVGGDTPNATLIPGGSADVILRVTNPNAYPVQVYGVAGNGAITADPAHSACTTTGVTFTAPAGPITPTVTVPAGAALLVHLAGAAGMNAASQSACQGATFHIPVTLAVHA